MSPARRDLDRVLPALDTERRFGWVLKACPFCGSHQVGLYMSHIPHITCMKCSADGPVSEDPQGSAHNDERALQAILKWNRRAKPQS